MASIKAAPQSPRPLPTVWEHIKKSAICNQNLTSLAPRSWTCSLQNCEKCIPVVCRLPCQRCFVTAVQMDWDSHVCRENAVWRWRQKPVKLLCAEPFQHCQRPPVTTGEARDRFCSGRAFGRKESCQHCGLGFLAFRIVWIDTFLLFEALNLWYFVTTTLTN